MKHMIRLAEDFVLLTALEPKWTAEVRHKCSCPEFARKACCEHALILAMMADPDKVTPPDKDDIRRIRQRVTKKKGRPSAEADSDSLDEARKKPRKPAAQVRRFELGAVPDSDEEAGDDDADEVCVPFCIHQVCVLTPCCGRVRCGCGRLWFPQVKV